MEDGTLQKGSMKKPEGRLEHSVKERIVTDVSAKFSMGDSVLILKSGEQGIVYMPADKNGDVVVQVKNEKLSIKHNRLKLRVSEAELYPEGYDFSIIFDSVKNRNARKQMGKHHKKDVFIEY